MDSPTQGLLLLHGHGFLAPRGEGPLFSQLLSLKLSCAVLCVQSPLSVMTSACHPQLQCPSNTEISTFCHLLEAIGIFVFLPLIMWFCSGNGTWTPSWAYGSSLESGLDLGYIQGGIHRHYNYNCHPVKRGSSCLSAK